MSGRPSVATEKALKLVEKGLTPYAAAKKVGIALSTIYRARKQRRSRLTGNPIPQCHCGKAAYSKGLCYGHFQKRT